MAVYDEDVPSFSSMVQTSKRDQFIVSPNSNKLAHQTSFEFHRPSPASSSLADVLLSDGQLVPQSFLTSSGHGNSNRSRSSRSSSCNGGRSCLKESGGGQRKTMASGKVEQKRVTFQGSPAGGSIERSSSKMGHGKKMEDGQGFLGSLFSVCKVCHVRESSRPVENKIYAN